MTPNRYPQRLCHMKQRVCVVKCVGCAVQGGRSMALGTNRGSSSRNSTSVMVRIDGDRAEGLPARSFIAGGIVGSIGDAGH